MGKALSCLKASRASFPNEIPPLVEENTILFFSGGSLINIAGVVEIASQFDFEI